MKVRGFRSREGARTRSRRPRTPRPPLGSADSLLPGTITGNSPAPRRVHSARAEPAKHAGNPPPAHDTSIQLHSTSLLQGDGATPVRIRQPADFRFRRATQRRVCQVSRQLGFSVWRFPRGTDRGADPGARLVEVMALVCFPPAWFLCRKRRRRILSPLCREAVTGRDGGSGNTQRRRERLLPPPAADLRRTRGSGGFLRRRGPLTSCPGRPRE